MTWERYNEGIAEALGAPAPEMVRIPTDLLLRIAGRRAEWTEWNFKYNNLFNNSAARADLGFRVTIPWVEGVRRTINWLEANGQLEACEDHPYYDRIIAAWQAAGDRLEEEFKE